MQKQQQARDDQREVNNLPKLSEPQAQGHMLVIDEASEKVARNAKDVTAMNARIKRRLDYLRKEIEADRISYGEIAELQSLAEYIDPDDVLLLEWAGVEEKGRMGSSIPSATIARELVAVAKVLMDFR